MKITLFEEIIKFTPRGKRRFSSKKLSRIKKIGDDVPSALEEDSFLISDSTKKWRTVAFGLIILTVFFVFLGRAFELQIIKRKENLSLAEGNRIRFENILAERGVIYDRNGEVLVRNKPAFILEMNTDICRSEIDYSLKNCYETVEYLAKRFDIDLERIRKDIDGGKLSVVLSSNLQRDSIISLEANLFRYPSLSVWVSPLRDYLYKDSFAHVLGYIGLADTRGPSYEGKMGVEKSYNEILTGVDGNRILQVDSNGREVALLSEKKIVPGKNVYLHIDKDLQLKAYELLKEKVNNGIAVAGVVVAQDPKSGGILALVSYPSFDPDKISSGISEREFRELSESPFYPFFNRAISAAYPPGSIFKLVVGSGVLEDGIIEEYQLINDPGFIQVGSFIYRNWNLSGHGLVDFRRALQVSNDTYFYTVGGGYGGVKGLGIERLAEWARKFGFAAKSFIDIPGEAEGYMPDGTGREWYLGDTYITSIGQGDVLATPLQVNNITSYFANGGYLFKPIVVRSTERGEVGVSLINDSLISKNNYEIVRQGMKLAVESGGTAYPFFDFSVRHSGIELAGKTGTSEFGTTENEKTHAWFTVFGPYENATIALTVFLEEGGGGSQDAAPIARELLDYWFSM